MKSLFIILACTTFCHQPSFRVGDCTNDRDDKVNPTYRKIVNVGTDDYSYQIANRAEDLNRRLYTTADIEAFDRNNIKVECPKWFR